MIEEFEILDSVLCDNYGMGGISENGYNEIMDAMIELKEVLQKQNNWISVEELPEWNVDVLIVGKGLDGTIYYDVDFVNNGDTDFYNNGLSVTHWQLLPGAPK